MKFCESLPIEIIDNRAVLKATEWPAEIVVDRGLFDFPQGPHVHFGRRGSLQFLCYNGTAAYRRVEDCIHPGGVGWRYVKTDSRLDGAGVASSANKPAEPSPRAVTKSYQHVGGRKVEAFQWLPHAVPPVALPDWFVRSDFEQNKDGMLTIRQSGGPAKAEPSDWIVRNDNRLMVIKAALFAREFAVAA